jgi:hypothetical protein
MGCWNRNGCADPKSGQVAVANKIAEEPADRLLVLGGDNVYPDKDPVTKRKAYSLEKLNAGIACLSSRRILAALGNHNIADDRVRSAEMADPRLFIPNTYYAALFADGQALVVLDSNVLDAEPTPESQGMLTWLRGLLRHLKRSGTPYILVQHHPVLSFKKAKIQVLPQAAAELGVLRDWPPRLLLVADTHNYQRGDLFFEGSLVTEQVVVGTGGADQDSLDSYRASADGAISQGPLRFAVSEAAQAFGYLRVFEDRTEFIEV